MIDLPTAFRLADRANPQIGISRETILETQAVLQQARVLLLPSLNGGATYHDHNGNLQRGGGAILNNPAEQSLYVGGGAQVFGSNSVAVPAVRIYSHLGDAIYEPLAARQLVQAQRFSAGATFNSVLLAVGSRYLELMGAEAQYEAMSTNVRDARQIAEVTTNYARVGQARQADADRMTTQTVLLESELQRNTERVAVAAAELAQVLNLDPAIGLRTVGGPIPMLTLVDERCGLQQLLVVALRQRPELAARSAQIAESQLRFHQERTRAFLPTVSIGFSAGTFGGGSNLVDPQFGRFGGRTDFDAMAFWTAQNFGLGNSARTRQRRAQADEVIGELARTLNQVRSEVAEAYAASAAQKQAIALSELRLKQAETGFREESRRIRGGEGLPIELLDFLTRLVQARREIIRAVVAYDQAQVRLYVALGRPPTCASDLLTELQGSGEQP